MVINIKEASGIITKFEEPNNTIPLQTNDSLKERTKTYPKIIEVLAIADNNQALMW